MIGVLYPGRHRIVLCRWEDARIEDVRQTPDPRRPSRSRSQPVYRSDTDRAWSEQYLLRRLIARRQELLDGRAAESGTGGPMTSGLFDEWIRASQGLRAAGTLQWYEAAKDRWHGAIGDRPVTEIDSASMERFAQALAHAEMAPATIRIYFKTLRTFLHWCARRGYLDKVPAAPRIERDERLPVTLGDDGVSRLLAHLRELRGQARAHSRRRIYQLHERFVLALLATGARRSELFYLRWDQFDFGEGLVRIKRQQNVFRVKEGREKVVPLPAWAVDWFSQEHLTHPAEVYLLDEPYVQPDGAKAHRIAYADPYQITHAIRRHLDKLGLRAKGLKPIHGFRAKMIDDLYKAEVDILTIQRRAGHAKIETTRGYIATPDAHARAAAEKLDDRWQIAASQELGKKLPN